MAESPDKSVPHDGAKAAEQAPAAGERRAIGGYQPQYRLAAELILKRLREGTLTWIRIADPDAGRLDDLQIAEEGRLDAYQVKWSRFPSSFTFRDLKSPGVDAPSLIAQLADGWNRLQATNPGRRVVVHLVTNDQPSTNDRLPGVSGSPNHFAAFLAECWVSRTAAPAGAMVPEPWKAAWTELAQASGLAAADFERFVANCRLDFGASQFDARKAADASSSALVAVRELAAWQEDVDALNLTLFKLVADPTQIVELSREHLLRELRWQDRIEFRNRHEFPEPGIPYQAIRETVDDLDSAIKLHSGGYLLLIGSPGSGKSTLLTQTMRYRTERVVRYYAYVPDALEPNALRGESINFFHDVSLALDRLGFCAGSTLSKSDLNLLVSRFHEQLRRLHDDFRNSGRKTIIVVDGLDHIAREQSPQRALLKDLPPPANVPEGVYIVLGSQTDQLQDLPPQVRTQLRDKSRRLEMRRLSRAAVVAAVSGANVSPEPAGTDLDRIFDLSAGHPLALAYIINYLRGNSGGSLSAVLDAVEPFKDRIDDQYETHWLAIENERALVHLLGLYARMRSAIDIRWIERWADKDALFALRRLGHYFRREHDERRYFFHNSFRAFLLERTRILPGVSSSTGDAGLYRELAEQCAELPEGSPWRWDELYYRAHAGEDAMVLQLATPDVLRAQFFAGRPIDAIQADIRHAMHSAIRRKDLAALSRTVLTATEYEYRARNVPDVPLPELFIALGEPRIAVEHVRDGNRLRISPIAALKTSDVLARAGLTDEAERVFSLAEPLEVLKGGEVPSDHTAREADELLNDWIRLAPRFRPLGQLLETVGHLRRGENQWEKDQESATRDLRSHLRFQLASALYELNRWDDFALVVDLWNPSDPADWEWWFWSHVHAWRHAQYLGDEARALSLFDAASAAAASHKLGYDQSVMLAEGLLRVRRDTAAAAREANALPQPAPVSAQDGINDHGFEPFRQRFRLNRVLGAVGDTRSLRELVPDASDPDHEGLVFFERLVAHVGRLWGQVWAGRDMSAPTFLHEAHPVIRFFSQPPKSVRHSWYLAQRGRQELYRSLIHVARMYGAEVVDALRGAFQDEWTKPEYAKCWGAETIRDIVLTFLKMRAPKAWAAECLALADARGSDAGDANTRMKGNEEQLRAHLALGDRAAAEQKLRVLLESSFAVGHKDSQLAHWIAWAELATTADPAHGAERFAWIASYLPSLRECDEVLPYVAKILLRTVCKWNPVMGLALLKWYFAHGIMDFTDGFETLLESLVRKDGELADVIASTYGHLVLPLDTGASSALVRELGRAFISRVDAASAPRSAMNALGALWEHIQVSALPSIRHPLWRVLSSVVRNAGLTEPQFEEPAKLRRASGSRDDEDEDGNDGTRTVKEFGDPPLTMDMIRGLGASIDGVLELLRREAPGSRFRWEKLVSELIAKATRSELATLADAFEPKRTSGRVWEVDLLISRRLSEFGDTQGAWSFAERVFSESPVHGWQELYDGGSRLHALETLGAIDRARACAAGFERLASDIQTGAVRPSTIAEGLDRILPAITDAVPTLEIWKVVEDYLKSLFATSKAVAKPDLTLPEGSDVREVLLRFAAEFLDHPTYQLACASQRLFVDLVCAQDPTARHVVADLLQTPDKPHEVLLAVLEAVNQEAPAALVPLREAIALGKESPHQGVRAAARRLLGVADQDELDPEDEPLIMMSERLARRTPAPLPAVYQLTFKPRGRFHRIREVEADRPLSSTRDTGEIVAPFRMELDLIAKAASVQPEALHERVVQIATEHDSRAFTDAEEQLRADLDAIHLRLTFRRPRPRAVRRAMFFAFAELVDAQLISNGARRGLERALLTYDPDFLRRRPVRRPSVVRSIAEYSTDDYAQKNWTAGVNTKASALLARSADGLVLAEETELRWLPWKVPTEKRYGVCVSGWPPQEILRTERDPLSRLCETWVQATVEDYAHRVARSECLIILQEGVRFESPAQRWLAFNPNIAKQLGWTLAPIGLFRWLDRGGQVMVESIWWEDGFPHQPPPHFDDEVGSGWLVIASRSGGAAIRRQYGGLTTCVRVERQAGEQTDQVATFQDIMED